MKPPFCVVLLLVSGGFFALASGQTDAPAPTVRPRRSISGDQNMAAGPAAAGVPSRASVFQNIPNPTEGVDLTFAGSDVQAVLAWLQRNTGKIFLTSQALPSIRVNYTTHGSPPGAAPGANGAPPVAPALLKRSEVVFALESLLFGDGIVMVALDADTVAVIPADSPLKRAASTAFVPSPDTLAAYAPGSPNRLSVFKNIPTPDALTTLAFNGNNYADAKTVFTWLQDNTGYTIIAAQTLPSVQLTFTTDVGQPSVGPSGIFWPGLKRAVVATDLERLLYINGIALLPSDGKSVLAVPVQPVATSALPPAHAGLPAPAPASTAPPAGSPATPDAGVMRSPQPTLTQVRAPTI